MLDTFMPLDRSSVQTGFDPAFPCNYMPKPHSGDYAGGPLSGMDSFSSYLEQVMGKDIHTDAYAARDTYRSAPVDTEPSPYRDANAPAWQSVSSLAEEHSDSSQSRSPSRPVADSRQPDSLGTSRGESTSRRRTPEAGDERLDASAVGNQPLAKVIDGTPVAEGEAGFNAACSR